MAVPADAPSRSPRFSVLAFLLLAIVVGAGLPRPAVADTPVRLSGHTLAALAQATKLPAPPPVVGAPSPSLTLTITLKRSDEAGFEHFVQDVQDPKSPRYQHFLSQSQLATAYGPSQSAYDAVLGYLQGEGFTLVKGSANRLTLTVAGTRAQADHAFNITIGDYALNGRTFYANDSNPQLPADIAADVQAIGGLSNLQQAQSSAADDACPGESAGSDCWNGVFATTAFYQGGCAFFALYTSIPFIAGGIPGALFALSRVLTILAACASPIPSVPGSAPAPPPTSGTGKTIGLLEFDSYHPSDVSSYLHLLGYPDSYVTQQVGRVTKHDVNGGVASPGSGETEVLLDIDTAEVMAPGASVAVYDAPFSGAGSFQALFNAMINDNVNVISNSWSYCEDQTTLADAQSIDSILASAAASGISVFNGSGDSGSTCLDGSPNTIGVPADSPHATAVGGTTLTANADGVHFSEHWWDGSSGSGSGGFGTSKFFTRPSYQDGLVSSAMRSVPDVAARADPASGFSICQADNGGCPDGLLHGGTSLAAPEWAAMATILASYEGHALGNLNTSLYPLANTTAFHSAADLSSSFAHVGLGSPDLPQIAMRLASQTPGPTVDTKSAVLPGPNTLPADGTSNATVAVYLHDANNLPVANKTVTLAKNGGSSAVVSAASGPSDVDGLVSFSVTDAVPETVTLTATDTSDAVVVTQQATLHFASPPATTGNIVALPTSVLADGSSTSTITVTLHDAADHGAAGKAVTLSQGGGHSQVTGPVPALTNASGQVAFTVTDAVTESVTYTAMDVTDGNLPVPGHADVSFTSGGADSCSFGTPAAGAGFAFSNFATGFPAISCLGPVGLAFDPQNNLLVVDFNNGTLYRIPSTGGAADDSTRVASGLGPTLDGIAFGKDGKLYISRESASGGYSGDGDVREINPTTGAVIRFVAQNIPCAAALATDPLSGDLFVSQPCPVPYGSVNILRIANPASVSPTVSVYSTPGEAEGMAFALDGTLFAVPNDEGNTNVPYFTRIDGTDKVTAGQFVRLAQVGTVGSPVFAANPADPGSPPFVIISQGPGLIIKLDLTQDPPVSSTAFSGGSRGDILIVGPDGCAYGDQSDRIIRIANADGSCPFATSSALPQLTLSPSVVSPSPATNTPQTFTASLHNVASPAGTSIAFNVTGANPRGVFVSTDANGVATFTYSGAIAGTDSITASTVVNSATVASNPASVTWTAGQHATLLTLNGSPNAGDTNVKVTLTASLTDVSLQQAIAGVSLTLGVGADTCNGTTNASGSASCDITPTQAPGAYTLSGAFAGTGMLAAASAQQPFLIVGEDTDGDGYRDVKELSITENPNLYCPIMRADVDEDGSVSILDLATVAGHFLQPTTIAPPRYDQDNDGQISILDLATMAAYFLQPVSACAN